MEQTPYPRWYDANNINVRDTVNHYQFNQDNTVLCVGTKNGFRIFDCFPLKLRFWSDVGSVKFIEMQYTVNIIALVGENANGILSPKWLTFWDTNDNKRLTHLSFLHQIVMMKMNYEYIFVAVKDCIYVHTINNQARIASINAEHSCRILISPNSDNPYLIYSSYYLKGTFAVYNLNKLQHVNQIQCHSSPIKKMQINLAGNLVATCSTQGSLIKVFNIIDGSCIRTLSNGVGSKHFYSLRFNYDSSFLSVSTEQGVINVFKILEYKHIQSNNISDDNIDFKSYQEVITPGATSKKWYSSLVPKCCDDYFSADKPIMSVTNLKLKEKQNICTLNIDCSKLASFCYNGDYYVYDVNRETKEITQVQQFNLEDMFIKMQAQELEEDRSYD